MPHEDPEEEEEDNQQETEPQYLSEEEVTLIEDVKDKSLTRKYMLNVVGGLHFKKQAAKEGRKIEKQDEKEETDPQIIYKNSLLKAAADIVQKRQKEVNSTPQNKAKSDRNRKEEMITKIKRKVSPAKYRVENTKERLAHIKHQTTPPKKTRVPIKSPSFSSIINEPDMVLGSPPDSPDPPHMETFHADPKKQMYTKEEVDALILNSQRQNQNVHTQSFTTSTPRTETAPTKPSPVKSVINMQKPGPSRAKDDSMRRLDTSALDTIERICHQKSLKKNRELFKEDDNKKAHENNLTDDSLLSIPPASPLVHHSLDDSIKDDMRRAELNTQHRALITDNAQIVTEEFGRMNEVLVESVNKITQGISGALREHAHNAASCMRESIDRHQNLMRKHLLEQEERMEQLMQSQQVRMQEQFEAQEKLMQYVMEKEEKRADLIIEAHKDNNATLTEIHSKLTDNIIKKELTMVQAFDRLGSAIYKTAEKMAGAQAQMITGIMNQEDVITKLNNSTAHLITTTSTLNKSNLVALSTASKADAIMSSLVKSMEPVNRITDAVRNSTPPTSDVPSLANVQLVQTLVASLNQLCEGLSSMKSNALPVPPIGKLILIHSCRHYWNLILTYLCILGKNQFTYLRTSLQ